VFLETTSTSAGNGWLAFLAVVAGGALTKVIDKYFSSHEQKLKLQEDERKELAAQEVNFRKELREQIAELRTELKETKLQADDLETMVADWKNKYYENIAANIQMVTSFNKITIDHVNCERTIADLRKSNQELDAKVLDLWARLKSAGL